MQKWEYAFLYWHQERPALRSVWFTNGEEWSLAGDEDLRPTVKRLGEEGWEMVGMYEVLTPENGPALHAAFKRPKE